MPSYPAKNELMFLLASKGYWVFLPRYRGSWESDGLFLQKSPHLDIIDIIDSLSLGFNDLFNGDKYSVKNSEVFLIGSSFGGPAAILASTDKRVKKTVVLSPVTDWRIETKSEPLDWLSEFTRNAFGNGYRFKQSDWKKLKKGIFYNPFSSINKIDKNKIFIIHAKDDKIVYADTSLKFANLLGCKLTLLESGGHFSLSNLIEPNFLRRVELFLNK